MSVWPSSAGNCGTGTYFSTSSWNCQADSTDRNLGLEIASLFFMIVGLLLIITIIIVIVVYKTSKNGKRYIVNTIKRIFVLHDGHGIDSTSTSPPFHNNMWMGVIRTPIIIFIEGKYFDAFHDTIISFNRSREKNVEIHFPHCYQHICCLLHEKNVLYHKWVTE